MQLGKRLCNEGLPSYGRFCAPAQSKTQKRIESERIFTFQFMKKANHLARFNDYDHQNWNFRVSKTLVSIILKH